MIIGHILLENRVDTIDYLKSVLLSYQKARISLALFNARRAETIFQATIKCERPHTYLDLLTSNAH